MFDGMAQALWALTQSQVVWYVTLGSIIGMVAGILPGLGSPQAMAVALPFTFGMDRITAIYFLSAICASATFAGSIPAILINVPGTPANAATVIEGYPMAKKGEANRALAISATASLLGGIVGIAVLVLSIPVIKPIVLLFGPPETFMLILLGLVTIAYAVQRNVVSGLAMAGLGILISLIGYSSVTGVYRFPLGSRQYLWDGIQQIPFLIGVFGLSEAIQCSLRAEPSISSTEVIRDGFRGTVQGIKDVFRYPVTFVRSSVVGVIVGIAPGVGGSVSNVVSYAMAAQMSKDPEIGKGSVEGLIACETANNATYGGDAIPTLAFGIAGSPAMAVLLGGLTLHGVQIGPWLMKNQMEMVWVVVLGLLAGTVFSCVAGLFVARWLARVTLLPMSLTVPVIVVFILAGASAVRQNFWDMGVAILSGIFGYLLTRSGFSLLPLIIGFLLGDEAERSFIQSLYISQGSLTIFFTEPLSLILFLCALAVGLYPVLQQGLLRRERAKSKLREVAR